VEHALPDTPQGFLGGHVLEKGRTENENGNAIGQTSDYGLTHDLRRKKIPRLEGV
jgi:hypothetical protein